MPNANGWRSVGLDGQEFAGVHFENCCLVYRGQAPVSFAGCSFTNCELIFKDALLVTADYLAFLVEQLGDEEFSSLFQPRASRIPRASSAA